MKLAVSYRVLCLTQFHAEMQYRRVLFLTTQNNVSPYIAELFVSQLAKLTFVSFSSEGNAGTRTVWRPSVPFLACLTLHGAEVLIFHLVITLRRSISVLSMNYTIPTLSAFGSHRRHR
jgi:hypothetical protein